MTPDSHRCFTIHFTTTASGTSNAHAAYVAQHYGAAKIILYPVSGESGDPLWILQGQYVDIVGFDISGLAAGNECGGIWSSDGSQAHTYSNNTYAFNRIHDIPSNTGYCGNGHGGGAIETGSGNYGSNNNVITDNVIWTIGAPPNQFVHGIYGNGANDVVSNNIVYGASGGGIHIYHNAQNGVIVNNTVVANGCWGIVGGATGPGIPSMSGMYFANNIIMNTNPNSASCSVPSAGFNECNDDTSLGGSDCGGATGNVITNNLFWNNTGGDVRIPNNPGDGCPSPCDQSVHMVQQNPILVNAGSDPGNVGDFHFQAGSPAITAGTQDRSPILDLDGNTRPAPPSIGAYDVTGGNPAPFVQQCANKSPSATVPSLSCTMTNPVTAGDLLVAMDCYITPEGTIGFSDSNSQSYSSAVQQDSGSGIIGCTIWYAANAVGGTRTTFTVSSGVNTNHWFVVNEYSGMATSAPLDVTGSGFGTSTTATTSNFTTKQSNELIVAMATFGQPGTVSAGSGFTSRFARDTIWSEDQVVSSTGSYNATETCTQSTGWVIVAATFKKSP